jgi:hypothetical protein
MAYLVRRAVSSPIPHEEEEEQATDAFGSDRLFFLTMPLVLLQEEAAPVATAVSSPIAPEEEDEGTDAFGSDRLFFLTIPLVLLQEEAAPVATAVSSPIALEEEEDEGTDAFGSDRLFFLTMPLVLLQEEAAPVATAVSSPFAPEEEEEQATDAFGSDRLFFLTMPHDALGSLARRGYSCHCPQRAVDCASCSSKVLSPRHVGNRQHCLLLRRVCLVANSLRLCWR